MNNILEYFLRVTLIFVISFAVGALSVSCTREEKPKLGVVLVTIINRGGQTATVPFSVAGAEYVEIPITANTIRERTDGGAE